MEKEIKVKGYLERIREELSYRDYSHAKELCVRVSNVDSGNLCAKYLREFIEMHKKENGRYEKLNILELCAYLYKSKGYITAENWESLSIYCDCVADELYERECEQRGNLVNTKEEYLFIRQCENSIIYLNEHSERLSGIVEQQQIKSKSINRLLEMLKNLKNRLESLLNIANELEEERKIKEEQEKEKKARDRLIKRWLIGGIIAFFVIAFTILTITGEMTW